MRNYRVALIKSVFLLILVVLVAGCDDTASSSPGVLRSEAAAIETATADAAAVSIRLTAASIATTEEAQRAVSDEITRVVMEAQAAVVAKGAEATISHIDSALTAESGLLTTEADDVTATAEARATDDEAINQITQMEIAHEQEALNSSLFWADFWRGFVAVVVFAVMAIGMWRLITRENETLSLKTAPDGTTLLYDMSGASAIGKLLEVLRPGVAGTWRVVSRPRADASSAIPAQTINLAPQPLPTLEKSVMFVANSGAGKTVAMRESIDQRASNSHQVLVFDPHYGRGQWGRAKVVVGAEAMKAGFAWMAAELEARLTARHTNASISFPPITVAVEEMPSVVRRVGKDQLKVWHAWIREGRKVGLYIMMVTQSTRVKNMGIEGVGDVLKNFNYTLLLGKFANEEAPDLVANMERPALLLDESGRQIPVVVPYDPRKDPESDKFIPFWPYVPQAETAVGDRPFIAPISSVHANPRAIEAPPSRVAIPARANGDRPNWRPPVVQPPAVTPAQPAAQQPQQPQPRMTVVSNDPVSARMKFLAGRLTLVDPGKVNVTSANKLALFLMERSGHAAARSDYEMLDRALWVRVWAFEDKTPWMHAMLAERMNRPNPTQMDPAWIAYYSRRTAS